MRIATRLRSLILYSKFAHENTKSIYQSARARAGCDCTQILPPKPPEPSHHHSLSHKMKIIPSEPQLMIIGHLLSYHHNPRPLHKISLRQSQIHSFAAHKTVEQNGDRSKRSTTYPPSWTPIDYQFKISTPPNPCIRSLGVRSKYEITCQWGIAGYCLSDFQQSEYKLSSATSSVLLARPLGAPRGCYYS